jgi:hypothetical protein
VSVWSERSHQSAHLSSSAKGRDWRKVGRSFGADHVDIAASHPGMSRQLCRCTPHAELKYRGQMAAPQHYSRRERAHEAARSPRQAIGNPKDSAANTERCVAFVSAEHDNRPIDTGLEAPHQPCEPTKRYEQ